MIGKIIGSVFIVTLMTLGTFFASIIAHELLHAITDLGNEEKVMCFNLNPNSDYIAYTSDITDGDGNFGRHGWIYFVQGMLFIFATIIAYDFLAYLTIRDDKT